MSHCNHCGRLQTVETSNWEMVVWICGGLSATIIVIGLLFSNTLRDGNNGTASERGRGRAQQLSPLEEAHKKTTITKFEWRKGGFDNIMIADFTIKNTSSSDVKDLQIRCTHAAKSGTEIDTNTRTIYEIVPAGKQKKFSNFHMGFIHDQASRSGCDIVSLELVPTAR
jgi:hypothetical protein